MLADLPFNALTHDIIGAAIDVHRELGPGLLESAYLPCLQLELGARRLRFASQKIVPITYKGTLLDTSYRLDLLVEDTVVVEVKSVERLTLIHDAQVLTYLRLTRSPAGLLINFNVAKLLDGVRRLINPDLRSSPFLRSSV